MKIFVDIDGTICITKNGYENSIPIQKNINKINALYDEGHHITYWTARGGNSGEDWTSLTKEQLQKWGCLYHELELGKPSYDVVIDDKALNFKDIFFDETDKISGIYKIQSNIKPERNYIGSAINIHVRWLRHLNDLRNNRHHSSKLQRHYDKYGEEDLQFSILLRCPQKKLIFFEQQQIDFYSPYFNNRKIADSNLGIKRSNETKKKISVTMTGREISNETREKIGNIHRGKVVSDETKRKISESSKGRKISDETKLKMGKSRKRKSLSEEHKRKISEGKKGKSFSDDHRKNLSIATKNHNKNKK